MFLIEELRFSNGGFGPQSGSQGDDDIKVSFSANRVLVETFNPP